MPSDPASPRPMRLRRTLTVTTSGFALVVLGSVSLPSPAIAAARTSYTVGVTPTHGAAGDTFTVTLTVSPGPCTPDSVAFYADRTAQPGTEIAPVVPMPASCTASATVTVPSSWPVGTKRIYATYRDPSVPPAEHGATFTVTAPAPSPTPSPTATATPTPSASLSTGPTPSTAPSVIDSSTATAASTSPPSPRGGSGSPVSASVIADGGTPQTRFDLASGSGGGGATRWIWLTVGLLTAAAVVAAMVVRRRVLAADEMEGRHRQAPGRWNASDGR